MSSTFWSKSVFPPRVALHRNAVPGTSGSEIAAPFDAHRILEVLVQVIDVLDHLHEHFLTPVVIRDGRYMPPTAPGYSITMRPDSLRDYAYPGGKAWTQGAAAPAVHR